MDELAVRYEYIIRVGHNIGRLGIPAAHADTFRALERSFVINRDKNGDNGEESLFNYAHYCGEVVSNISHAVFQFEKEYAKKLSDEDKEDFERIENLLVKAKIDQIEQAIGSIEVVFRRHGRYM